MALLLLRAWLLLLLLLMLLLLLLELTLPLLLLLLLLLHLPLLLLGLPLLLLLLLAQLLLLLLLTGQVLLALQFLLLLLGTEHIGQRLLLRPGVSVGRRQQAGDGLGHRKRRQEGEPAVGQRRTGCHARKARAQGGAYTPGPPAMASDNRANPPQTRRHGGPHATQSRPVVGSYRTSAGMRQEISPSPGTCG